MIKPVGNALWHTAKPVETGLIICHNEKRVIVPTFQTVT